MEEREEQERAAKIALMTSDLVVDCYMDDRVRNVEVFNEVKDTFVAGINAATFFASMSNPVSASVVFGTTLITNVVDGGINIMQGQEEKGIAEISLSIFDGVELAKGVGWIPEGTLFNPLADDAIRAIDDVPITNVTHIEKVSLSDTGISAADVKNSSIKNVNIENGGIKKVNIKNTSI